VGTRIIEDQDELIRGADPFGEKSQ
jgi:hypothetical protein